MTATILYANVTNTSGIRNVAVTASHDASTSMATIEAINTTLTLGDLVTVDMGYSTNHQTVFTGYVKQIDRKTPDTVYSITCADVMTRAMDYFIASSDPENPLKYRNIKAEELIRQLMLLAGLSNFTASDSTFTFGVQNEFEVNMVPVFEYCRAISDNLTWAIWADDAGMVHFENRKPYPMSGSVSQPGWVNDPSPTFSFSDIISLDSAITTSEKNLRNRVVIYGSGAVHAEAFRDVSNLPAGFYKTSVLGAGDLIDDQTLAQTIADYNLDLFCRYTEQMRLTIVGDPSLRARMVVGSGTNDLGITGTWYVELCDHALSSNGYVTTLGLRRMPVAT